MVNIVAAMSRRQAGQATIESTIGFAAGLLLLFGSLQLCFWFAQRYVRRQQGYERTRVEAGTQTRLLPETLGWHLPGEGKVRQPLRLQPPLRPQLWDGPSQRLEVFGPLTVAPAPGCPSFLETAAMCDGL